MKFPRHARIFRGHLDATAFAGVFCCLLIFVLLGSLVYTPGVLIHLPQSTSALPGVEGPTVAVALDTKGVFYFRNQIIQESNLVQHLKSEVAKSTEPLTLVVRADKDVSLDQLNHLRDIAAANGIKQIDYTVLPRLFDSTVPTPIP